MREEHLTASTRGFNPHRYLHQTGPMVYIHELFSSQKGGEKVVNLCISSSVLLAKWFSMLSVLISYFGGGGGGGCESFLPVAGLFYPSPG